VPLSVIAAPTHHSDLALQNVYNTLQIALDTYRNDDLSTGADLRAGKAIPADPGSCINVAKCDALVNQAINEFNALVPLYLISSAPTHENVNNAIADGRKLIGSLNDWAVEIGRGESGTTGGVHTAYNILKTQIDNAQSAVVNLDLPPLPDPPDLATLASVSDVTHPKASATPTDNRIVNLHAWLVNALTIYNIDTASAVAISSGLRVRKSPGISNLRSCKIFNAAGTVISTATIDTGLYIDVKTADAAVTKVISDFNKLGFCYNASTVDTAPNVTAAMTSRQDLHNSLTEWSTVITARRTGSPLDLKYVELLTYIGVSADDYLRPTVQAAVNGLINLPLPAPPDPNLLTLVNAITHSKTVVPGNNLLEALRNALFNVSTNYNRTGLRSGNMTYPTASTTLYFDIAATDQLVTDIITSFNALAQYYTTGRPDAYTDLQGSRTEINKLQSALTNWATNIEAAAALAAKADPKISFEYNSLADLIGGIGVSTSILASARYRVGILILPNPPPPPDPSTISVPGPSGKVTPAILTELTGLYNELVNTVTTYGNSDLTFTNDLRRGEPGPRRNLSVEYLGPYLNVEQSDKHANEVITAFNNLENLYKDVPPSSPTDRTTMLKEIADARTALTAWVTELAAAAAAAPEPLKTAYQALIASVNVTLLAKFNTLVPPVPDYKYTRKAKLLLVVNQPSYINGLVITTGSGLDTLLTNYNQCCASYLLDWVTIGPYIKAVDDAFDVLQDSYDVTPRNIATARQTAINKKAFVAALTSLQSATRIDSTFAAALLLTPPNLAKDLNDYIKVLIGSVPKNLLTGATLMDSEITLGMKLRDTKQLMHLSDPSKYPKFYLKDIGSQCQTLIIGTIKGGNSLRNQIFNLWKKFRIDPADAEKDLSQIESDVETVATICLKCAMTGDPSLIPAGEAAKTVLLKSLADLEAKVLAEPLLEDALHGLNAKYKTDFTAAIKKVSDALNAIILKWSVPSGVARGMSAPTRLPPLPDSMRLIHYEHPPTDTLGGIFQNVSDIPAGLRNDVVIVAQNENDLDSKANRLPKSGPRLAYGLIVHRQGDMVALYKAIAICLKQALPPEIAAKKANRKSAATGWLYDIVRFESGANYMRLRDYIKPELYAVDT